MYAFVNGPFLWIAFSVFIAGSLWQIAALLIRSRRTDRVFYNHADAGAAAASVFAWLVPFASRGWREHPGTTAITFVFHVCLIALPLFALGHTVTLDYNVGLGWPNLPDSLVDALTLVFLAAAAALLVRRMVLPQVRIVTGPADYLLWAVTVLPFLSGYLAANGLLLPPDTMLLIHVLAGGVMLICLPFTRLAHAFLFFFTRSFIGSEFARRGTKTW
jgi:nitrate reductase gamma subunit